MMQIIEPTKVFTIEVKTYDKPAYLCSLKEGDDYILSANGESLTSVLAELAAGIKAIEMYSKIPR